MTRKQKRIVIIGVGFSFIASAVLLIMFALSNQITYFYSPADIVENPVKPDNRIRLGGLVEEGTIKRGSGTKIRFVITDGVETVTVEYDKILPDLFREGQGVITEGSFKVVNGPFIADTILAKHDENYMPKEVSDSLKKRGVWQDGQE